MLISGQFGWSKIICSRNRSVHSSFVFACFVTRWNIGRALFGIVALAARALFTTFLQHFRLCSSYFYKMLSKKNLSDLPMYVPAVCALTVISLRRIFMRTTNYSSCIWKCRVTFERYSDMLIAMANLSNDTPQVSSSLTCIHSFVMGMLLKSWPIDGSIASWGLASKLLQTALPCWTGGEQ